MDKSSMVFDNGEKSVSMSDNYGRRIDNGVNDCEYSFRGNPIPKVVDKKHFEVSDSQEVIDKVVSMSQNERSGLTIDSVHFGNYGGIEDVKLTTGDIVPVETAIALAENHMLSGYTTGKTVRGERVLRSKPDPKNSEYKGLYSLPSF